MLRGIKYELHPKAKQAQAIRQACGCCRLVYNTMLDQRITSYTNSGTTLSCYEQIKQLPSMKEEKTFLKDVPSQSLQQTIKNLDSAYKNFFRNKQFGFPKFKKKGGNDKFRIPVACEVDFDKWRVKIAKIGWVEIYRGNYKPFKGTIKSYAVSYTSTGRYFISIQYETTPKPKLNNNKSVGIDVGIKTFAVLSTGEVFENQKYLKQNLRKLRVLQRSADRKYKKGVKTDKQSKNWKKAMKRVSKLHEKIRFQRQDYLHKISTYIARNYSQVFVEDLNIKGMEQNHHLAQAVSDCGCGMFVDMLTYKCDSVVKVNRWFASSQTCSECGYVNPLVKDLSVREWCCPVCGAVHDRDVNAAKNIEREGLSLCGHNVGGYTERVPEESHVL